MKKIPLIISLIILIHCSEKKAIDSSNLDSNKVYYSDRQNPYAKMQFPVEVSWNHDKEISVGRQKNLEINIKTLANLTDSKIRILLPPDLKLSGGESEKEIPNFTVGSSASIVLSLLPQKKNSFIVSVHISGKQNGESIGTSRTVNFSTTGFEAEKPKATNVGENFYEVLEGKTDNHAK